MFPLIDEPHLPDDPDRDPQETAFLHSIVENPDDDAARLVFADWLEDNGRADKAAFVRLEVELSRSPNSSQRYAQIRGELFRLDEAIGGRWSWAFVRPGRLLNCGGTQTKDPVIRFAYRCPNRWADLTRLADRKVRHCGECRKNVHFCASKEEAESHAVQGHCVAIGSLLALAIRQQYGPPPQPDTVVAGAEDDAEMGEVDVLGMPSLPPSAYQLWADELFARHRKRWWQIWK